jgi:hypothetical protein
MGEANNPTPLKIFLRHLKEMELDGYLGNDTKQYTKFCG